MVAGLEDITEGEIRIGDRVVNDMPPKDRDIAMVFQNYALYPHMTVEDNVLLDPAVDIARVPLGGRLPEAMGEDPYLTSRLAVAEVRAIQDRHVISMVKHFIGNNAETERTGYATSSCRSPAINTVVGERTLQDLYYPPFKAAVQRGGAGSVMGSYNRLNGTYACQHPGILHTLKHGWGWDGFVAPDFLHAVRDPVAAANAGSTCPGWG